MTPEQKEEVRQAVIAELASYANGLDCADHPAAGNFEQHYQDLKYGRETTAEAVYWIIRYMGDYNMDVSMQFLQLLTGEEVDISKYAYTGPDVPDSLEGAYCTAGTPAAPTAPGDTGLDRATPDQIERAREQYARHCPMVEPGDLMIDDNAVTSESAYDTWVSAWVRLSKAVDTEAVP